VTSNTLIPKDAALKAVGRTVVNFQRLEHNLKLAARLGPVQGTLSKIKHDVEKRATKAASLTLGQAIYAWLDLPQRGLTEAGQTPDLFESTMAMSFSWECDAKEQEAHGAALKALLDTRNNLIHGGLVHVQWDSPEECERLIAKLEAVNASISTQLEFVTSILKAFGSLNPEDVDAMHQELERQLRLQKQAAGET
jgi:hypothetical protein